MENDTLVQWSQVLSFTGGVLVALQGLLLFVGDVADSGAARRAALLGPAPPVFEVTGAWLGLVGIVAGGAAIAASVRLADRTAAMRHWGLVAVVAGGLSVAGLGGWGLGAIAAIVGGSLAVYVAGRRSGATPRPAAR